jgi:O-antigen/teichoic acid export membrane protein
LIFIHGFLFAHQMIGIIYGGGFSPSMLALQILTWVVPLIFLTYLFGVFLESTNGPRVATAVTGVNCAFNVVLNIMLIPRFGLIGASVVTVLTEALGFILLLTCILKNVVKISLVNYLLKPVLVTGITVAFAHFNELQSWFLAGIVALFLYGAGLFVAQSPEKMSSSSNRSSRANRAAGV